MKIAVYGWYGHGNFGDDIAVLGGLKNLFLGHTLKVFSDKQPLDFTEINRCDLFVLGGGELINSDRLFSGLNWANKISVPKIVLGCGVNVDKSKDLKKQVVKELEQFSYIGVRDFAAYKILSCFEGLKNKLDLFYDLAFSLPVTETWRGRGCYSVVFPTDRSTRRYDRGIQLFNTAKCSVDWLRGFNCFSRMVFVPFGGDDNNDLETCRLLCKSVGNGDIVFKPCLNEVYSLLVDAKLAIAYRLHGYVLAKLLGVPCVVYPYHWKLSRVYESTRFVDVSVIKCKQALVVSKFCGEKICV
jgi:polysaccharide pyruvyl transferase WcaK-like protein